MDTAGQERFKAISRNMFKNVDGIILMYDVTNEKSFVEIKDWIKSIKKMLRRQELLQLEIRQI